MAEMTIKDAISWYEAKLTINKEFGFKGMQNDAARMALSALRAQLLEQENKPLTLEEFLNIQEPTPFWIVSIGDDFSPHWSIEFWNDNRILIEILEDNSNNTMREREVRSTYGKTWLAYRRKSESVNYHET